MDDDRNMVQGAEVWIPRGELLVSRGGAYGDHAEFAHVSGRTTFRRGEGLPGAVWSTGQALLWHDLGVHFVRAEHAAAAGLDAAIGIPVFRGSNLSAVVVLLLTRLSKAAGCIELWSADDDLRILKHEAGHYCHSSEFERFSRLLQFQYDTGLPGTTYRGSPRVIPDVRNSSSFIRRELAGHCGLKCGVGIPIFRERRVRQVLTLIAAERDPFLCAAEVWTRTAEGLRLEAAAYEGDARPATQPPSERTLAELVLSSGVPSTSLNSSDGKPGIVLGIPIHDGEKLSSVVCLTF